VHYRGELCMGSKKLEKDKKTNIDLMSFEEALAQLELIVDNLEKGESKLDDAISAYERGILLKKHCEAKLNKAKSRVAKISIGSEKDIKVEELELERT